MKKIVIIDYGLSNLHSVKNAFDFFGVDAIISQKTEDADMADVIILPGVGAFEDGMKKLDALGLLDVIRQKAASGTPILGICLGMQMLFDESEEFGLHNGLGLIPGRVERIPDEDINGVKQKIPHISWNPLYPHEGDVDFGEGILDGIRAGDECYFIHSFEAKPTYSEHCLAETLYGGRRICAVVRKDNVMGTQFHPEKSGEVGSRIIKRFIEMYCV